MRLYVRRADAEGVDLETLTSAVEVALAEVVPNLRVERRFDEPVAAYFHGSTIELTDRARALAFDRYGIRYEWVDEDEYWNRKVAQQA